MRCTHAPCFGARQHHTQAGFELDPQTMADSVGMALGTGAGGDSCVEFKFGAFDLFWGGFVA